MLEWLKNIWGNMGTVKDAVADPVNTSGEVTKDIVSRLNPALQRIVVLVLIVVAMILGADMGIDYQQSKAVSFTSQPTIMDCSKCPVPEPVTPAEPDDKPSFSKPLAEPMKAIEVWKPTLEPITLPGAKPANPTHPRQAAKPVRGERAKPTVSLGERIRRARKAPAGTRHAAKPNRPVRSHAAREKLNNYKVWKGLPLREATTSGPGGY